jgi:2-polyprenyl-3-methyl-5-hydroxy-6-metoxy-1,4-benzoquinol methylase
MDEKLCLQVEDMPDFKEKFNMVAAQWVLEHVKNPDKVIEKLSNNCLSGGYFLFMTTNLYSPLILLSKIFPTGLKKFLKNKLLDIPENETYPTYYRINTPAQLDYYMNKHGFKKIEVKQVGVLTYFAVNKPVLFAKAFLDKILLDRFSFFKKFSTHLVGVYQKV